MEEQKSVVIAVDDEPRNIRIIQRMLNNRKDITLITASSGEDALMIMKEQTPDIVLLDIMMPGTNGYDICKNIKSSKTFNLTKVILVSGKAMIEERLKGYEVGADDYITKPFVHEELMAKVDIFLKLVKTEKKLTSLNNSLEEKVKIRTDQLLNSEKMASIGMNTAQIIHNINNPLFIISGYTSMLAKQYPKESSIEKIAGAVTKLEEIITYSLKPMKQNNHETSVDLNNELRSELELINIKKQMQDFKVELDLNDIPKVKGIPAHFNQIFGNLIKNAVDAMYQKKEKKLTIKSSSDNQNITISIADSGIGISTENMSKIFDPFFTTKATTSDKPNEPTGTGLGLPSCIKMVESYKGSIEIDSKVDKGTTFTLKFPIR